MRLLTKIALAGLTILVGVLALALVLGLLTPATRQFSRRLTLAAPPEAVWTVLTEPQQQLSWRPTLKRCLPLPNRMGKPVWQEVLVSGEALAYVELERVAPKRWCRASAEPGAFVGRWTYDLVPVAGGTRLTLTERDTIPNPFLRFTKRYLLGEATEAETTLRQLAAYFGHGARFE